MESEQSEAGNQVNLVQLRAVISESVEDFCGWLDLTLHERRPSHVLLGAVIGTLLLVWLTSRFNRVWDDLTENGWKQSAFGALRFVPLVEGMIEKEKNKVVNEVVSSNRAALPDESPIVVMPRNGLRIEEIKKRLTEREKRNVQIAEGCSTVSGTVYMRGKEFEEMLNDVYSMHSRTNPLHANVFPSIRLLEAEVISMTASMMGGGPDRLSTVCGAMTGGGTESILMAVKASRDYMKKRRGITQPHMIIAQSAHAAYWKAAEYFKIKISVLPVDKAYKMSPRSVKNNLGRNTVLVVASAYGYPHGIVDPIEQIGAITKRAGVPLHVDGCLGGFVLHFASELGRPVPKFDFSVEGVTSMSIDTHKYGMAHKGTSVVLYRFPELRRCQYTSISDWTGGLYISPGLAGSRSGALIATAWASLMYHGLSGFKTTTKKILECADRFKQGIETSFPQLEVIGEPQGSVIAFRSMKKSINIFKVHDLMTRRGWHLNTLQFPPGLHMCFTARHTQVVELLLKDLKTCVDALEKDPDCVKGGSAAIYGTSCSMPDRRVVGELLDAYQDAMLEP
ncbi:hypothetical protein BSKO_13644 [Bryopsis sp. KO-2023]|nr:hypothetical protein BSKO_13644 [Bryopsis sp. KO-2023]